MQDQMDTDRNQKRRLEVRESDFVSCRSGHSLCFAGFCSEGVLVVKNPPANAGRCWRQGFDPWVRKIPWRRVWQPIPVFLPGESMNRRAWWSTVLRVAKVQTTETTLQACTQVTAELALWGSRQRVKPGDNNEVVYEYFSLGNVFLCTLHCIHAQIGALSSRNLCFKGKLHMSKVRSFIMCNNIGSENSFQ